VGEGAEQLPLIFETSTPSQPATVQSGGRCATSWLARCVSPPRT